MPSLNPVSPPEPIETSFGTFNICHMVSDVWVIWDASMTKVITRRDSKEDAIAAVNSLMPGDELVDRNLLPSLEQILADAEATSDAFALVPFTGQKLSFRLLQAASLSNEIGEMAMLVASAMDAIRQEG